MRYICPYSPDILREMYHVKKMTMVQIAQAAATLEGWAKVPTLPVAKKWLEDYNIRLRDAKETRQLSNQTQKAQGKGIHAPDVRARAREESLKTRRAILSNLRARRLRVFPLQPRKRGRPKKKIKVTTRITLPCDYCAKPLARTPYEHKRLEHRFCNHSCATAWRNQQRGKAFREQPVNQIRALALDIRELAAKSEWDQIETHLKTIQQCIEKCKECSL